MKAERNGFLYTIQVAPNCVMHFGLCSAPSTFQQLMKLVLTDIHWSSCLVYHGNIIIYSHTGKCTSYD